jgi:ABC-2 type transport system ATP-binding protein
LNDPYELEVAIDTGHDLNSLFAILSGLGIRVVSLRNKANRLEELFMGIVEKKQGNNSAAIGSTP